MDEKYFNPDRLINSALSQKGWIDTLALEELFKHKLEELGISKNQALNIMGIETKAFDAFMQGGSTKIDYLTALKLAVLLEIAPSAFVDKFINKIQAENISELEKTKVRHFIVKNFDLDGLRKVGFIDSVSDLDEIERRILKFFGYRSVFQYKTDVAIPVYSSGKITSNKESQLFWVNMACATFERIPNPNAFDRQELIRIFPTLRAYSLNIEHGLLQVMKLLFKVGVTVIYIPKIYKDLHIRAATFSINDKPCIALTNYRDFYPTLWFALFHELYHVLYDWDEISVSDDHAHLSSGVSTATIDEDAANQFAARYLFDEDKMKAVEPFINDEDYVKKFARSYNVHESIVYALYAYAKSTDSNKLFGKYRHLLPAPKATLDPLQPGLYEKYEPIPQIIKHTMSKIN